MRKETFFSITLFILGVIYFFSGFHNIDNGFNMCLLDEWESETFVNGEIKDSRETYLHGIKTLFISFWLILFSFMLLLINETKTSQ